MNIKQRLRHLNKIFFHKDIFPEQITLFVTSRCNLKCSHCFYHSRLNTIKNEFTPAELEKVLDTVPDFSFLSLGGGEPFLRDDLPRIAELFSRKCGVTRISVPTNGFLTDKVVSETERMLKSAKRSEVIIKVSIDGPAAVHDKIRGAEGSFDKAVETFRKLKGLKPLYGNLRLGVLMTCSALNQDDLDETYSYVKNKLKPDVIGLNYVRGGVSDGKIKDVDYDKYKRLYMRILDGLVEKNTGKPAVFYRFYSAYKRQTAGLIKKILRSDKYPIECLAGRASAVIDSALNVYPCESLQEPFGNLRDFNCDFRKLWFSENAGKIRGHISEKKCCCTNECNLQNNSFFNIKQIIRLLLNTL